MIDDFLSENPSFYGIAGPVASPSLVLVVATMTGLATLWINNPAFGGTSYLLALLWGFGLNEVAQGFLKIATANGTLPVE